MSVAVKFDRVVTYHEGLPPKISHDPLSTWYLRPSNKLELINHPYHDAYDHQTFQGGYILLGAPTLKVI